MKNLKNIKDKYSIDSIKIKPPLIYYNIRGVFYGVFRKRVISKNY